MRMLSALDASFIYLESDHSPMHIGGVYLFDADEAPSSFSFETFRTHIKNRLSYSQVFRQRLVEVPLSLSHPYWINDPDFDLEQHIPRLQLPAPGGLKELMQLCAQISGTTLERKQPLWQLNFVEGLDAVSGMARGSFAVISKVHHAAVDGGSGVELMGALLDAETTPRVISRVDDWQPEHPTASAKVVAAVYSRLGRKSLQLGKLLGEVAKGAVHVYDKSRASRINPPTMLFTAPVSILNGPVSSSRTYWGVDFEFSRIRQIRHQVPGVTVNDVVLAVCAGGLRNYLLERDALPDKSLIAMAPISVRKENQKNEMGNQVSAMLVSLATEIADPLQRLLHIKATAQASKMYSSALPAHKIAEFIPSETLAAAARLYTRTRLGGHHRPFFNLIITNVPGPPVPLYLAGAKISRQYGMAPIMDGLGLIIVVLSYAGRISLGLTSCYKVIPDPAYLGQCLERALEELETSLVKAKPGALREMLATAVAEEVKPKAAPALQRLRAASRALDEAIESLQKKNKK